MRRIARGEEITIAYLPGEGCLRKERQAELRRKFGFTCACAELCALTGAKLARSDKRQLAIGDLPNRMNAAPSDFVRGAEKRLVLLEKEQLPCTWGKVRTELRFEMKRCIEQHHLLWRLCDDAGCTYTIFLSMHHVRVVSATP